MIELQKEIDELVKMKRELSPDTLRELGGKKGNYVERLSSVAERTFKRGDRIGGTTIQNPSFLAVNKKGRLEKVFAEIGFAMFVRDIELNSGYFVTFPLRTVGISRDNIPVIEPTLEKDNYTVAYLPMSQNEYPKSNPAEMRAEFLFNVDSSDYVTVNGLNPVTPADYIIFDTIVCEFEQRST